MPQYLHARNPHVSTDIDRINGNTGPRRSVQRVLALVDTADPAWPEVAAVLQEFIEAGIDLDETATAIAVKVGKHRWASGCANDPEAHVRATPTSSGSIVYYVRRGEFIKIGTTADPHKRFGDLLPDEILAYEPGDRRQEALRHRQFNLLRSHRREYFIDTPELRDHIARMRALYGEPDPSWPTNGRRGDSGVWKMPAPAEGTAVTAAEASVRLGINENTIRGWAHRGRLPLAGKDARGRCLYYLEHMLALRDSASRRLVTCVS